MIVETFKDIDPLSIPAVLVKSHGAFAWGKDASEAAMEIATLYVETMETPVEQGETK